MLGLQKRPLQPLEPAEFLQRQRYAHLGAQPAKSPREIQHEHVFIGENNLKRSYHKFKQDETAQQLLAQQLNQPRIRPTGESWTPPKNPEDPDTSMTDAPPVRRVHYTPPAGWEPNNTANNTTSRPGSILKRRMQPYDNLPYDRNTIHSPFEYDYSGYIEETERRDAEVAEHERLEREREEAAKLQQLRLLSRSYQQYQPRLDVADFGSRQQFSSSQSRLSASHPKQTTPPLRKVLAPVPRRASPQNQQPPPRPSAIDLYPQLAAAPVAETPSVAEEPNTTRRFGGMFVTVLSGLSGLFTWAYHSLFGSTKQEIYVVETNNTGRKRRAVAAGDIERDAPSLKDIVMMDVAPENFFPNGQKPNDERPKKQAGKQEVTPPVSRPGSSESNQSNSPNELISVETTTTLPKPLSQGALQQNPTLAEEKPRGRLNYGYGGTCKFSRPHRSTLHMTAEEEELNAKVERVKQLQKNGGTQTSQEPRLPKVNQLPRDARRPVDRTKLNQQRDDSVDSLLAKTERITLQSREHGKSLRESKLRKERKSYEQQEEPAKDEPDFKERARLDIEKETIELRKKADQEAKEEAERDAEEAARAEAAAAEKRKLIRELPSEWADRLDAAMGNARTNPRKVLTKASDGTELSAYDLGRIIPPGRPNSAEWWLNDEGVNAVMTAIVAAKNEQTDFKKGSAKAPEIVAYNSAWYTTYKAKGITGLKTWSRRSGLQGKVLTSKTILFPINTLRHWLLMIIRPQDRVIEILDSLDSGHREQNAAHWDPASSNFFKIAHEWLKMELGEKYTKDEWTHISGRSEQQVNGLDCGVFTCMNALAAAKGREASEVTSSDGMIPARRMIVAVLLNGGFHGDWEL